MIDGEDVRSPWTSAPSPAHISTTRNLLLQGVFPVDCAPIILPMNELSSQCLNGVLDEEPTVVVRLVILLISISVLEPSQNCSA